MEYVEALQRWVYCPRERARGTSKRRMHVGPTIWVAVGTAEAKIGTTSRSVPPEFKSRRVARGDPEGLMELIRTDSPTCDLEAINLTIAFAAASKLKIRSADISNA